MKNITENCKFASAILVAQSGEYKAGNHTPDKKETAEDAPVTFR